MDLSSRMRLHFCLHAICLICATLVSGADASNSSALVLAPRPLHIFKTADRSHENTESWTFSLMAELTTPAKLTPSRMSVNLSRDAQVLSTTIYSAEGLEGLTYKPNFPARGADGTTPTTPVFWPFAVRIRGREPMALGVNVLRVELDAIDEGGHQMHGASVLPLETYQQKVKLIFPFRGNGIILQGGA